MRASESQKQAGGYSPKAAVNRFFHEAMRPDDLIISQHPRLGRFLVSDFMHYIAERRRPGVRTLFIIDEFNALRMLEETSILFEQVRDFGGSLIISAQGYAGLGPHEYAERILD